MVLSSFFYFLFFTLFVLLVSELSTVGNMRVKLTAVSTSESDLVTCNVQCGHPAYRLLDQRNESDLPCCVKKIIIIIIF